MTHFTPKTVKTSAKWLMLPLALLTLFVWSGSVSAAQLVDEHPKPDPGVLIVDVDEDSPAAEAGIARGDILLAIDGDAVNTAAELKKVILMYDPDDTVELTVRHGDEERTLTTTLGDHRGRPLLGVTPHNPWSARQGVGGRFKARAMQEMPFSNERFKEKSMQEMPFFNERFKEKSMQEMPFFNERFKEKSMQEMPFFDMTASAMIGRVREDSPAAAAGLEKGDVITDVDEMDVADFEDLVAALAEYSPGDEVQVTVDRDGEEISVPVTLAAHPEDEEKAYLGVNMAAAAMIGRVQEDSPAADAGLEKGDVITAVDEMDVAGYEDLVAALAEYSPGDEVQVTVDRDGEEVTVPVTLAAHPKDEEKAYLGVSIVHMEHSRRGTQDKDRSERGSQGHIPGMNSFGFRIPNEVFRALFSQFFHNVEGEMPYELPRSRRMPADLEVRQFFNHSEDTPGLLHRFMMMLPSGPTMRDHDKPAPVLHSLEL